MPLANLLYRCPRCGHDRMRGEKDEVACSECGVRYARGGEGGLIRIEEPSGEVWEVPGTRLTSAMHRWGERKAAGAETAEGLLHSGRVTVRRSGRESPVYFGGELIGFAEAMGEPRTGTVSLSNEVLKFQSDPGEEEGTMGKGGLESWPLLRIRSVQTSSSSLQVSPSTGGLVEFRFENDSPFRWENLLRQAIREAYRRAGLGEIVEFQPRIVTG